MASQAIKFLANLTGACQDKASAALCLAVLPEYENVFHTKLVSTLNKAEHRLHPRLPAINYEEVWDYEMLLDLFRNWPSNQHLSLMQLSQKTAALLLLCTARRHIDIANLTIKHAERKPTHFAFVLPCPSKTYVKEKYKDQRIVIKIFPEAKVCPYRTLYHYIDRTAPLRECNQLFITTTTFTAAAQGTISRWVKTVMKDSGVDVKLYTPHTTRHASVSKHATQYKNIGELLKLGQWRHLSTFYRHYLRKPKYPAKTSSSGEETVLTRPLRGVPAIRKVANFRLRNALRRARSARKRLDLPRRVPFTDIPLKEMEQEEHVTVLDLDPDPPAHDIDDKCEDVEINSVVTSSGSHITGLTGLDLEKVDNQLSVRHCAPTKSELSDAKLFILHKEIDALESNREQVTVSGSENKFKKPSHKPLILQRATRGGFSTNTNHPATRSRFLQDPCTALPDTPLVRNMPLTRGTCKEIPLNTDLRFMAREKGESLGTIHQIPEHYKVQFKNCAFVQCYSMKPEHMFQLRDNDSIFPFDSSKRTTKKYSIYDKIVLHRLDNAFPVIIRLAQNFLSGNEAVLRFSLAMTEEVMNSVFLSGGFGCVTDKGPCIFVSANDLYLLQTESDRLKTKEGCYLFD